MMSSGTEDSVMDLTSRQKRARAYAIRRGHGDLAEDFAQEAVIAALRGWSSTIEHLFIDFLRREQGSSRTAVGRARQDAGRRAIRLDAPVNSEEADGALNHELVGSDGGLEDARPAAGRFAGMFHGLDAQIYERVFVEEDPVGEVAQYLGVTAARVSQLLKPIKQRILVEAHFDDLMERFHDDPGFGISEVAWFTL